MNFSGIFVRRPVMATLLALAVVAFGLGAYQSLPVSDLPNVSFPYITVSCEYDGASAQTMASNIATPLEQHFQGLQGLNTMYSKSLPNYTKVELKFDLNRNIDFAAQDVQAAINRAMSDLPSDLNNVPTYTKVNPAQEPIVYLTISSSTLTPRQLYLLGADRVVKALSRIEGVASTTVWGSKPAVRIKADPDKMAARGLSLVDLATVLKYGSETLPAGTLMGDIRSVFLQPQGQLMDAAQYNKLIVTYADGAPVHLEDIGRAVDSTEEPNMQTRLWRRGKGTQDGVITLGVLREPGANTVAVSQAIRDALPVMKKELPGSVQLNIIYDLSVPILAAVNDVRNTLIIAFFLVVGVIFLFLGRVTDTIIPSVALPASLLLTLVMMYLMGFNLDLLSLMALTMAVGFLVDDAIVVLENTVRHMDQGKGPFQAALDGSAEITGTVWSMTMSLAAVFIPLVFMPGVVGRVFQEFALTIVAAILCSGLISITLTPAMCGKFLRPRRGEPGPLERASEAIVGKLRNGYLYILRGMLRLNFLALVIWVLCLVGTVFFFKHLPMTFFPTGDSGVIYGNIHAQHGTSNDLMQDYQKEVEQVLSREKAIDLVYTVTGMGGDLGSNKGFVFTTLVPRDQREDISKVSKRVDDALAEAIPGAQVFLGALPVIALGGSGGGGGADYEFALRSPTTDQLYKVSQEFYNKVRTLKGFRDVQTSLDLDAPQLDIEMNRARAAALGLTVKDIETNLLLAYAGFKVNTINAPTDLYKVIIEVEDSYKKRPVDLSRLYVRPTGGNGLVPLGEVARWKETVGPLEVKHMNQENEVKITFDLDPGVPLGDATKTLDDLAADMVPADITAGFQGQAAQFKKTTSQMFLLMILALVVMYLVLGVLYESYIHPITVLSALPVAGFGGLLTLWLFNSVLSIYSFIGIFLLMGIVKKNGIMMVDFANDRIRRGKSRREAIYEACEARFRPIVMTGVAAIMGAMPIALGLGADGASRQPLGLTVVGGLMFSQLITLFVTPVLFLYMEWFQEKVLFRFSFFRPPPERTQTPSASA